MECRVVSESWYHNWAFGRKPIVDISAYLTPIWQSDSKKAFSYLTIIQSLCLILDYIQDGKSKYNYFRAKKVQYNPVYESLIQVPFFVNKLNNFYKTSRNDYGDACRAAELDAFLMFRTMINNQAIILRIICFDAQTYSKNWLKKVLSTAATQASCYRQLVCCHEAT